MNRSNLEHLARVTLPALKIKFDLKTYGLHTGGHAPEEDDWCGTMVCGVGAACLDPFFQAQGLVGEWQVNYNGEMELSPWFNGEHPRFAFGLDENTYDILFMPGQYPVTDDVSLVIDRIEELLKHGSIRYDWDSARNQYVIKYGDA